MKNELKYYLENGTETLFAYGDFCEFFEMYNKNKDEWETSKISYSQLLHDYWCSNISKEEAEKMTNGKLPENAYKEYCELFSKGRE